VIAFKSYERSLTFLLFFFRKDAGLKRKLPLAAGKPLIITPVSIPSYSLIDRQ
jgi:hypothetical protein